MTEISPTLRAYSQGGNAAPPRHLGSRYNDASGFLPEPGNTVVCHLVPGSATEAALVEVRQRFLDMPGNLLFTPTSSLHMTLFQGIIETRREPGFWPRGIALDSPIDAMTDLMEQRLEGIGIAAPFSVEVTGARPSGLIVAGRTAADRVAMRAWRDAFAALWGYRHPDHEDYLFHITFAYPVAWLDDALLPAWQATLDHAVADLRASVPVLELKPPAFCSFNDMNHFEELRVLPFRG